MIGSAAIKSPIKAVIPNILNLVPQVTFYLANTYA